MIDHHSIYLLSAALIAVLGLIFLIAVCKLNPFITLLLTSLALGLAAGMPASALIKSFEAGVGGTLGHIVIVVGLGTMLGKMMAESGGADQIAFTLIRFFGEENIPWAMLAIGLIVGLPAFFEVGFVLLIPIAYTVARRTGTSLVLVGLPMLAGLSVVHGLVPPHPAALLAVTIYHADVGRTIFYALVVGLPAAVLAGPVYAKFIAPHVQLTDDNPMAGQLVEHDPARRLPGFGITLLTILSPVALMLLGSLVSLLPESRNTIWTRLQETLRFLGNDDIALLLAVLLSFVTFGKMRGYRREAILRFTNDCLAPTAAITLLVGAGGGFGRILMDSGIAKALIALALLTHIPLLAFAWTLAALLRLATGSSTVAMTTAAGIVAPIALHSPHANPALLAIATGSGSLIFSHVNDGGFWLIKQYFNMSVTQTIQTWSVCETIIAVTGLVLTLGLSLLT